MKGLSKSRYTAFCQCPKNLWLKMYKPEVEPVDEALQARLEQGNVVGDLAMGLFGDYKEAHAEKVDKNGNTLLDDKGRPQLDLAQMVEQTRQWMQEGVENICEASFALDGHYCAVDILRKNSDGWDIYEVKSSSFPEEDGQESKLEKYAPDIAYQKWLLTQCGVEVKGTYLVCLNSNYVRQGELDLQKLFAVIDLKEMVENEYLKVPNSVKLALKVINNETEPELDLSEHCAKPYKCAFLDYCKRQHGIPEDKPTVFDLYRMSFKKALDYYHNGQFLFDDLASVKLNDKQQMQIEATQTGREFINPKGIKEFLDRLTYPLYFLDFETMQDAVPQYDGAKVYGQITFQYSLHIKESETAKYEHREFLAPSDGSDPRRPLAEQLCKDIPMDVCTLAYNKMFECGRIRELAALYPDLAPHLLNIADHIIDLIDPFRAGDYYVPAMGGSFSIKSVLPALFPNDPELDYHNLDKRCQNGGDAMTIFPRIKDMEPEEAAASRKALLNYCKLDTWAMVKVWQKLKEMAK